MVIIWRVECNGDHMKGAKIGSEHGQAVWQEGVREDAVRELRLGMCPFAEEGVCGWSPGIGPHPAQN